MRNVIREASDMLDVYEQARGTWLAAVRANNGGGVGPGKEKEDALCQKYLDARRAILDVMLPALESEERCRHDTRGPCAECASAQEEHLDPGGPTVQEQQAAAQRFK